VLVGGISHLASLRRSPRLAHAVLDVVVDDEVQLFLRESVLRRQRPVDFIEDGLAGFGVDNFA
jgi:hypothetical protein